MATSPRSHIEIKGFEARHYDTLLALLTLGGYQRMLRNAVQRMRLEPGHRVLEFGCGPGIAACPIAEAIGPEGFYLGLDISPIMLAKAERKCRNFRDRVAFRNQRIDEPLPFHEDFDRVFISFVLHGFEEPDRRLIVQNAARALKPGGEFFILDYNEFDVDRAAWPVRFFIRRVECPLAEEFIRSNLQALLASQGFTHFETWTYFRGVVRLQRAVKS